MNETTTPPASPKKQGDALTPITTTSLVIFLVASLVTFFIGTTAETDGTPAATALYRNVLPVTTNLPSAGEYFTIPPLEESTYRVREGESVWRIAERTGLKLGTIITANPIIESNAHEVREGQKLTIPNRNGIYYTVKKGDTLEKVITPYGIDEKEVLKVNGMSNARLAKGERIFLPGAEMSYEQIQKVLQRPFLIPFVEPLETYKRISSWYGWRRDPFTKRRRYHKGIDLAAHRWTKVLASRKGTVVFKGWKGGYGRVVIIRHSGGGYDGYTSYYAHLQAFHKTLKVGKKVKQGQVIAYVGTSGRSTGPHLHFEIRKHGKSINPVTVGAIKRKKR